MKLSRNSKKFFLYLCLSLIISSVLSILYIIPSSLPSSLDNRLRDYLFTFRGEMPNSGNVVIIDIDEASLEQLGQ